MTAARKNRYRMTIADAPLWKLSDFREDAHRIISSPNSAEDHWQQEMLADFAAEALSILDERDALKVKLRSVEVVNEDPT